MASKHACYLILHLEFSSSTQTISYLHVHKDVQNLCSIQLSVSYSCSLPPIHMLAQRKRYFSIVSFHVSWLLHLIMS